MTYAAGLLGYRASNMPPERVADALKRAPWRGAVTASATAPHGAIHALGSACLAHHRHVAVAFHGRIDNLPDLRRKTDLRDGSTGQVVAATYLHFGPNFAEHLLGDFAILVLDEREHIVLGARDWVGTRPLFAGHHGDVVAFGSEVKQVLALLSQAYQPDEDTLAAYARMEAAAFSATFAAGVAAVPPNGQTVAAVGRPVANSRRPVRFTPVDLSLPEAANAVRVHLETAVARRVAGAGGLGALVSGGMDSTAVAATAAKLASRGAGPPVIASFTTAYPEVPEIDETAYARAVAARWDIPWHPVVINPSDLLAWPDRGFVAHDGPTFPGFGMYDKLMTAAQSAGVDTLLTGDVGDFWIRQDGRELEMAILRGDRRAILQWSFAGFHHHPRHTVLQGVRALAKRLLRKTRAESYYEGRTTDYWLRFSLESEEREGMRHGLRVEHPFCDRELASLLAGLPPRVRSSPRTPLKLITREAMIGLLPEEVRIRPDNPVSNPFFVQALASSCREGQSIDLDDALYQAARLYIAAWRRITSGSTPSFPQSDPAHARIAVM